VIQKSHFVVWCLHRKGIEQSKMEPNLISDSFRPHRGSKTIILLLIFIIFALNYVVYFLEVHIWNRLFKADWDFYQNYYTITSFSKIAGLLFVTVLLSHFLKISDRKLMFLVLASAILSRIVQVSSSKPQTENNKNCF
jgi:hypothetical protein